jgi:hypothetical protein
MEPSLVRVRLQDAAKSIAGLEYAVAAMRDASFGVFDHVDRGDQPLGELYSKS